MRNCVLLICMLLSVHRCFAHGEEKHDKFPPKARALSQERLRSVNAEYVKRVRPIFASKCFDCHSKFTRFPWYHKLPGIKQVLERDVVEGRKHLDMTNDFPFGGHGDPVRDLREIEEVLREENMPPFCYRLMHWNSKLSEEESKAALDWVSRSTELLSAP